MSLLSNIILEFIKNLSNVFVFCFANMVNKRSKLVIGRKAQAQINVTQEVYLKTSKIGKGLGQESTKAPAKSLAKLGVPS